MRTLLLLVVAVALSASAHGQVLKDNKNPFDDLIPKSDVPPCKDGKSACEPWERVWEAPTDNRWWEEGTVPLPGPVRGTDSGDNQWERYVRRKAFEGKERYVLLSFTGTGSAWFLEIAGVIESWDNLRRFKTVWIKIDHSQDRTIKHRTTMRHVTVNCQEDSIITSAYAEYAADGSPLKSASGPALTYEAIFPETMYEIVAKTLCKGGKSVNTAH